MHESVTSLIDEAVKLMLDNSGSITRIAKLNDKHDNKIHFIPKRYRIFSGLLQSMNIQFGNFIEKLMTLIVENDGRYEVIDKYSGKKSNSFKLSATNDNRIDAYISQCQIGYADYCNQEFRQLLESIIGDTDENLHNLKHDIDLLFRDKQSGVYYYLEVKYNDDHDTGKFVDINRKFIKTYAYLTRELGIETVDSLVPILFFFNNKKMKGNIYLPEATNIRRGKAFFDEFLSLRYEDVDAYMKELSERPENIKMFDELYQKIVATT